MQLNKWYAGTNEDDEEEDEEDAPNASADGSGNNENKDHSIEWICEEMAGEERDEA